ncbi:MAG: E3 ubiquitin ligase family protein [Spirochaetia bacterium]|nr:E3 ubiquitin ligase family protein [Spirochaetia bacterium]
MLFIPIGLGALTILFFFLGRGQGRKAYDIAVTETSDAAELESLSREVAAELGAGSFASAAEVKGVVESPSPLQSEYARLPCVWYRSSITREYETTEWERDSDGHRRSVTKRHTETVSSVERSMPFLVRDQSGTVEVDPEGAKLEGEKVMDRFEGSLPPEFGGPGPGGFGTLGYRIREEALTIGRRVYVLGEARDEGGRLLIQKPSGKGGRFLITTKSEEELLRSAKRGQGALMAVAALCGASALIVLALMILKVI